MGYQWVSAPRAAARCCVGTLGSAGEQPPLHVAAALRCLLWRSRCRLELCQQSCVPGCSRTLEMSLSYESKSYHWWVFLIKRRFCLLEKTRFLSFRQSLQCLI